MFDVSSYDTLKKVRLV